ncbi:MAG: hypothetical protein GXP62_09890 [Oligoflexia bacterium]|nr:hypothetical protein [Oligoflexia bacterium]
MSLLITSILLSLATPLGLVGCKDSAGTAPATVAEREPGQRTPLTRLCDQQDDARCLLPWPSSAFMQVDDSTETGLRVAVDASSLVVEDDPRYLNLADGFSRLSPVTTMINGTLSGQGLAPYPAWSTDAALKIYNAEPDDPNYAQPVPLWTNVYVGGGNVSVDSLLLGYPRVPLAANAEHVVVITDDLTLDDGSIPDVPHETQVILGLADPQTDEEAAVYAYHAPTRALLDDVGIDPAHVLRVWDFTTRSRDDPTRRLASMIDQVAAASDSLGVELDSLTESSSKSIGAIVFGQITGVPEFRDADGRLVLDADGLPIPQGETQAPFRVVLPRGTGAYRVTLYGHGTGGDVTDDAFDEDFASYDIAKAGTRFIGWTGDELVTLFSSLGAFQSGVEGSTTGLMQSVANTQAILVALNGPLADALSADTIAGVKNPVAGRTPDMSEPMWMGGSLGGAMGSVISSAFPQINYSVCNVPNGAWSHTIPGSLLYDTAIAGLLTNIYGDETDVAMQFAISQTSWDDIDGAAWADKAMDKNTMFLLQESMDDPVVLNPGTDILAVAQDGVMIGPALQDIPGLGSADQITSGSGLTQFRVPNTGVYDVHGFAARDTPAGAAAFQQIIDFVNSVWIDDSPLITFPDLCTNVTPNGDCDFTEVWTE